MRPAMDRFERVRIGRPYSRREGWDDLRYYPVRVFAGDRLAEQFEAPSVTTVLGLSVPKPGLVHWAAKVERELVLDTMRRVIDDMIRAGIRSSGGSGGEFVRKLVADRLGDKYAHRMKLHAAGEIGTEIHRWIDWHHLRTLDQPVGKEPPTSIEAMNAVSAYLDLEAQLAIRPIGTEERVASPGLRIAGTIDTRAWVRHPERGDVRALIDYKSGKEIYDEALQQVGAYALAHNELCALHDEAATSEVGLIIRLPKVVGDPLPDFRWIDDLPAQGERFIASLGQFYSLRGL